MPEREYTYWRCPICKGIRSILVQFDRITIAVECDYCDKLMDEVYPINEEKLVSLQESIERDGFWTGEMNETN